MSEFKDVIVWAVIGKGREERAAKMIGKNRLCLLQDHPGIDFLELYGARAEKKFLIFNPDGCLSDVVLPTKVDLEIDTEHLFDALRGKPAP